MICDDTTRRKIVDISTLSSIVAELRSTGKRVVQCHGCFDVVHPGHIRHLKEAATYGDVLCVSVTADPQIDKGPTRPFVPQELRCENLAALAMVDYVVVVADSWAGPILEALRPDVYVKGLEYATNRDPRFLKEKQIVESYGGSVVFTSGEVVYSSTRLTQDRTTAGEFYQERLRLLMRRYRLTPHSLVDRLSRFDGVNLVVIGDVLLDHYVECEQGNVTTEAPVLQVTPIADRFFVGGAGVLALHAANMGANVTLVGYLNPHERLEGKRIDDWLAQKGVRVRVVPTEVSLCKTRYLVDGQKVFKVDRCRPLSISTAAQAQWAGQLESACRGGVAGVLAVDFGYGALTRASLAQAVTIARSTGASIFGDTSSNRYCTLAKFADLSCDAIFPNESEVRAYLGEPEVSLPVLASELFNRRLAPVIAVTLGPRGVVVFENERQSLGPEGQIHYLPEYVPPLARFALDPLGAGDALSTVATLTRLAGGSIIEAVVLGSVAAAIVIQRMGNDPVTMHEIHSFLFSHPVFSEV
jgi:rfaE bifunctional protein nucleotidyltransferase chain/domain